MTKPILTLLAAILLTITLAGTAQAVTVADADPQYRRWAVTWEGKARQARAELAVELRLAGLPMRTPLLRPRTAFVLWYPSNPRQEPFGVMRWRKYGTYCKAKALLWGGYAEALRSDVR